MTHYDLVIVGTGSGNSLIGPAMDDWKIGLVEEGAFGGTCLNRGCIPTKMLIHPADLATHARDGARFGISTTFERADWPAIRDRVFGRIDPIAAGGENYRRGLPHVTVHAGHGRFTGAHEMAVNDETFTADRFVIAAGARPLVLTIPGLDPSFGPVVPYHTSDSIMRLERLPRRLVILGGGFIACEMAHIFGGLGCEVVIVNRGPVLLAAEDHDVAERFTEMARDRYEVVTSSRVHSVTGANGSVQVHLEHGGELRVIEGDVLLVATGRIPNGDLLDAERTGLLVRADGSVPVDAHGRTNVAGIWALGDVNGRHQLKHMANGEGRVVAHNLMNPNDLRSFEHRPAPHAVFADPQVGAVGLTEREAVASGRPFVTATHGYGGAAWGWALEDQSSFAKLIGDPTTGLLLGAHIIGPQASTLVSLLVQGMYLGNTIEQMASDVVYIHPAPSEVVEQALLKLLDVMAAG